jgi:hypothetical protein
MSTTETNPAPETEDKVWERMPFSLSEQLKILLIFVDGLPFRSTNEGYPNRLDVGEASDLCGWSERHLHLLIHRAMELGLIVDDGDRFYMTERVEAWERGELETDRSSSRIPAYWTIEEGVTSPQLREDHAVYDAVVSLLNLLERDQADHPIDQVLTLLEGESAPADLFEETELEDDAAGRSLIHLARDLGFVDVIVTEDQLDRVKINERGEKELTDAGSSAPVTDSDQSLPMILQPDGRMMLPLESPLEHFRQIHPYVLLTGIDNMIEYNIDGRSLVKAENEGWDTRAFYEFLEAQNGSIPDTVESLFEESKDDAEDVRIESVHHLLTFEKGATAAEAMRVLSNYQPERVDENRLILRSSSSPETIKKNLSRAGIRIQMATGPERGASPLKEIPEDDAQEEPADTD